jgi:2-oxoglutarate ferredoxin oxidoreductase subunit delta
MRMNYIKIDKNKCKACYLCIDVCPKKLLKKGVEQNSLGNFPVEFADPNGECLGCAMCAMRCPDLAIIEVKSKK